MLVANTAMASGSLPLTRRDILPEVEGSLLLIANSLPATSQEHLDERDTRNTHPSMTAGQKRVKEIKRSNSYRRATERLSVHENAETREELKGYFGEDNKRKDDNTLKHASSNVTHKSKKESLFPLRIFSKKSGTDASSDTDDDQSSAQLGRKKKSVFIRLKERLEVAFIKDRNEQNRRGEKQKQSKDASDTMKTYRRKSHRKDERKSKMAQDTISQENNESAQPREFELKEWNEPTESQAESQHSPGLFRKDLNIFKTLRDSFRRKSLPQYTRQGSKDSLRRNSKELHKSENCSPQSSNVATHRHHEIGDHPSVIKKSDKYSLKSDRNSSEIHAIKPEYKPEHNETEQYKVDIHFNGESNPSKQCRDNVVDELESTFEGDGNHATELFGAIIDPNSTEQYSLGCQERARQSPRSPTKGSSPRKMKLEGLEQRRSRSFENTPSSALHLNLRSSLQRRSYETTAVAGVHKDSLSHEEECKGLQHDGSGLKSRVLRRSQEEEQSELSDAYLDEDDQKRKINNVARRLKIIADQKVEEKKRYATEEEIVIALKEIAEEIDRKHGHGFKIPGGIPREFLPVMKNMILAKTYACFAHVIQQEVGKTIGWEQIALYTFLAQSSLQITGVGRDVGRRVKSLALKYFSCKIRPWVESRPYGWESIHEETDIETDLD